MKKYFYQQQSMHSLAVFGLGGREQIKINANFALAVIIKRKSKLNLVDRILLFGLENFQLINYRFVICTCIIFVIIASPGIFTLRYLFVVLRHGLWWNSGSPNFSYCMNELSIYRLYFVPYWFPRQIIINGPFLILRTYRFVFENDYD